MTAFQHPRLREIAGYIAGVRAELAAIVTVASAADMARPGAGGRWNGAQIIEHLGKAEGSIAKYLEGTFATALGAGLAMETESSSVLDSLARLGVQDAATRPLVAPDRLRPSAAPELAVVWESLQAVRLRTLRAFATVDGRALDRVSAPHPFFGPLNGYEWFVFIGQHEVRHIAQLRRHLSAS